MTRKPKPDALARLLEHVDNVHREFLRGRSIKQVDAKTRRLVRALLKERAEAAAIAANEHASNAYGAGSRRAVFHYAIGDGKVRAAVLRPRAAKGRAAR